VSAFQSFHFGYIEPPAFIAVTGQATLIGSGPRAYAAVDIEAINAVDRTVRDIGVLTTAGVTLDRLEGMQAALEDGSDADDRIAAAIGLYGTREEEIQDIAGMVRTALATVLPDTVLEDNRAHRRA
jgi:RPA family protein